MSDLVLLLESPFGGSIFDSHRIWPVCPRVGETISYGGAKFEVLAVHHGEWIKHPEDRSKVAALVTLTVDRVNENGR